MRRLLRISIALIGIDLLLPVLIYFSLPDTSKLSQEIAIERKNVEGKPLGISIQLGGPNYVSLSELPAYLPTAVLVLEDARFFEHRGFDPGQIAQALEDFIYRDRRLRGASTISQQLVKNLYLSSDRSFQRKLIEALITIKVEMSTSKQRILEVYLNSIDWGRGIIGIQSAARHYFRKAPSELEVGEAVFLAAIIPNPVRFSSKPDGEFVRKQMFTALERLYRMKLISLDQYQDAIFSEMSF